MEYVFYPDTLYNMAVQTLGNYVSKFLKRMIKNPSEPTGADGKYHHYQGPCSRLEDMVTWLPTDRVSEVTLVLIGHVNNVYTELVAKPDTRDACEEIAPLVLKSVIHPCVKSLDCIRYSDHRELLDYYKIHNCDLIYKTLPLLRGLKELKLGVANRTEDMRLEVEGFKETLEIFSSRSCRDSDLEILANNCKKLRRLDISCNIDISDKIVDHIIKFERLEELILYDVSNLSTAGLLCILKAFTDVDVSRGIYCDNVGVDISSSSEEHLRDNEDLSTGSSAGNIPEDTIPSEDIPSEITSTVDTTSSACLPPEVHIPSLSDAPCPSVFRSQLLKTFGCKYAGREHIYLISQFSNLTSLILSNILSGTLTPLKNLKHLRAFALRHSEFFLVEDLLKEIGSQLYCLGFTEVVGTNLYFISRNCRSVLCLHICIVKYKFLYLPRDWKLPGAPFCRLAPIPSVKSLQIFVSNLAVVKHILTSFRNLTRLYFINIHDDLFFKSLLQRVNHPHLQKIYWSNHVTVTFDGNIASVKKFYSNGVTHTRNIVI
jgi:hypothetical protein